ncbi:hypothetical protein TW95_gp1773 [Pandoravirus inopinatum]|uniref:Uncharacterized protein n=1 Tax=Pandoravirus inopinatum TaxID=1605721 RepID=A0A0B5JF85_9VIRU|nr:hypothetical protein TW95_gp1773 [Pandoravirus inopinatum]AJF98507.1 hypothetical protein [Pandoravirus inopinatum]
MPEHGLLGTRGPVVAWLAQCTNKGKKKKQIKNQKKEKRPENPFVCRDWRLPILCPCGDLQKTAREKGAAMPVGFGCAPRMCWPPRFCVGPASKGAVTALWKKMPKKERLFPLVFFFFSFFFPTRTPSRLLYSSLLS